MIRKQLLLLNFTQSISDYALTIDPMRHKSNKNVTQTRGHFEPARSIEQTVSTSHIPETKHSHKKSGSRWHIDWNTHWKSSRNDRKYSAHLAGMHSNLFENKLRYVKNKHRSEWTANEMQTEQENDIVQKGIAIRLRDSSYQVNIVGRAIHCYRS